MLIKWLIKKKKPSALCKLKEKKKAYCDTNERDERKRTFREERWYERRRLSDKNMVR